MSRLLLLTLLALALTPDIANAAMSIAVVDAPTGAMNTVLRQVFISGEDGVNDTATFSQSSATDFMLTVPSPGTVTVTPAGQTASSSVACLGGGTASVSCSLVYGNGYTVSGATLSLDLKGGDDRLISPRFLNLAFGSTPVLVGGSGTDVVDFGQRTAGVTASAGGAEAGAFGGFESVVGSPFDDKLSGFTAVLDGGGGNDTLTGAAGAQTLSGGPGADTLDGGTGADVLQGGTGTDIVTYEGRTAGVTASLDGQANDGEAGEGDAIGADVEGLRGGSASDVLTGSAGDDRLEGGPGNDSLTGGAGVDTFVGGSGDDSIDAADSIAEDVGCGDGADTVLVDALDRLDACETVRFPPPPASPAGPAGATPVTPPDLDKDHDGTTPPVDCAEGNPAIHPGAVDIPGNKIDEDCSGADAKFPRVTSTIVGRFSISRKTSRVLALTIASVPSGGKVEVRCTPPKKKGGKPCAFSKRAVKVTKGKASLASAFKGRRLPSGTVIEVRVTASARVGSVTRYTVGARGIPKRSTLCLQPGATKPASCGS